MSDKDANNGLLTGQAGDVQSRVALLRGRVDPRAALQQLGDDANVTLFGGQVQGVEAIRVARVDVRFVLEVFEHLVEVARSSGSQKRGILVRLENESLSISQNVRNRKQKFQ